MAITSIGPSGHTFAHSIHHNDGSDNNNNSVADTDSVADNNSATDDDYDDDHDHDDHQSSFNNVNDSEASETVNEAAHRSSENDD